MVTATVKPITAKMSNVAIVKYAETLSKLEEYQAYEVWCVFDFDIDLNIENQKQDYNLAIEKALKLGFNVAYSNDAFEL